MISKEQIENGIAYAESNFINDDSHLKIDKELIREIFEIKGNILDFGCGMGGMSLWFAQNHDCLVKGIDIDENHIFIANKIKDKYKIENASFELKNILEEEIDTKFDLIFLNDVAEHIPLEVLEKVLHKLKEYLVDGGRIFLSYPPWESPYASHLNHVISLPWCQFLPDKLLFKWLKNKDLELVGTKDLKEEYQQLNRLTHKKIKKIIDKVNLKIVFRKSNTKINRISTLKNVNLNYSLFKYLVTKEFLILE